MYDVRKILGFFTPSPLCLIFMYCLSTNLGYFLTPPPPLPLWMDVIYDDDALFNLSMRSITCRFPREESVPNFWRNSCKFQTRELVLSLIKCFNFIKQVFMDMEDVVLICTQVQLAEAMVEWLRRQTSNPKSPVRISAWQECLVGIWTWIGGNAVDSLLKLELYSFIVRSFPKWSWFRAFPWPSLRHFWDSYRDTLTETEIRTLALIVLSKERVIFVAIRKYHIKVNQSCLLHAHLS